jgi:hypothetical protein
LAAKSVGVALAGLREFNSPGRHDFGEGIVFIAELQRLTRLMKSQPPSMSSKPADLPVQLLVKFKMVVNLKTTKALGLTVPQSILLRADEGIE